MANEILMQVSQDEKERAHYRSREMFQRDLESDMAASRRLGDEDASSRIARNMLVGGEPMEKISLFTGLTVAQISALTRRDTMDDQG